MEPALLTVSVLERMCVRYALGRCDGRIVFDFDALIADEPLQLLGIVSRVARRFGKLRKSLALGLSHIKDVGRPISRYPKYLVGFGHIDIGLTCLPFDHHRRENHDALLALFHMAPELMPGVKACDLGSGRTLSMNEKDVPPTVAVKSAHG